MTISQDLFLSILSMDAYNEGYAVGVQLPDVQNANGERCTLKLGWGPTRFPVSTSELPWLLPRPN